MKTWFVTGVRSGLGRATAKAALDRGDTVVGVLRTDLSVEDFEKLAPGRAIAVVADITNREAVFAAVAKAESMTGGIDIVMNNAANQLEGYIEEAAPEAIRAVFESNIMGAINVTQAFLPHMRRRGKGLFINMSSKGGLVGYPWVGFYCTTKFAMEGFSEALQREVGELGINVTIIEAGGFRTELFTRPHVHTSSNIPDYERSAGVVRKRILAGGGNEPGDPKKFAQVMLKVADADQPPLRIAVGSDAIEMALGKAQLLQDQINAWRDVCSDLDLDAADLVDFEKGISASQALSLPSAG